jgi:hypothetical protein
MDKNEYIQTMAERFEQHQSDVAMLQCPVSYLVSIGIHPSQIKDARGRERAYAAECRRISL